MEVVPSSLETRTWPVRKHCGVDCMSDHMFWNDAGRATSGVLPNLETIAQAERYIEWVCPKCGKGMLSFIGLPRSVDTPHTINHQASSVETGLHVSLMIGGQ